MLQRTISGVEASVIYSVQSGNSDGMNEMFGRFKWHRIKLTNWVRAVADPKKARAFGSATTFKPKKCFFINVRNKKTSTIQ